MVVLNSPVAGRIYNSRRIGALKLKEALERNVYLPDNEYIKRARKVKDLKAVDIQRNTQINRHPHTHTGYTGVCVPAAASLKRKIRRRERFRTANRYLLQITSRRLYRAPETIS